MSPTDIGFLLGGGLSALMCILGAIKAYLISRHDVEHLRAPFRDAALTMAATAVALVCLTVALALRITDGSAPEADGAADAPLTSRSVADDADPGDVRRVALPNGESLTCVLGTPSRPLTCDQPADGALINEITGTPDEVAALVADVAPGRYAWVYGVDQFQFMRLESREDGAV